MGKYSSQEEEGTTDTKSGLSQRVFDGRRGGGTLGRMKPPFSPLFMSCPLHSWVTQTSSLIAGQILPIEILRMQPPTILDAKRGEVLSTPCVFQVLGCCQEYQVWRNAKVQEPGSLGVSLRSAPKEQVLYPWWSRASSAMM